MVNYLSFTILIKIVENEKYELGKLIVPTFPSYKRELVETIGEYIVNGMDFSSEMYFKYLYHQPDLDFSKFRFSPEEIRLVNSKRRISSVGIKILDYSSRFLEEEVNTEKLGEAKKTLSNGLEKLKNYEVSEKSLAALHDLHGYVELPFLGGIFGGLAPIEGELEEKKPSAYSSFNLSKDDKEGYISSLRKILYEAYDDLKEGFKSDKNDEKFEILVRSLLSKEDINLAQIIATNEYVRSVLRDVSLTCNLSKYFEESGLKGFHKLSKHEKLRKLREAGFRPIHPFIEKIAPYSGYIFLGGFAATISSSITLAAIGNLNLAMGIATGGVVGSLAEVIIFPEYWDIIKRDVETLKEIVEIIPVKKN